MAKVLAAVDRGDASYERVLRAASEQAREGSLTVLCVSPAPLEWISDPHHPLEEQTSDARHAIEVEIREELAQMGLEAARVWVPMARRAHIGDDILDRAGELAVDRIVIGTHGRKGLGALLIGSVAERVVRHATCDVYVVRADPG